jgi:hypothetical protein
MRADRLTTVNREEFEGKMEAYKFGTIYFNVYRFGKIYRTMRFQVNEVWKISLMNPEEGWTSLEMTKIQAKAVKTAVNNVKMP